MSIHETNPESAGRPAAGWLGALAGAAVAAAMAMGSAEAMAQSGDFPLTDNPTAVPTYNIPAATCDTIQEEVEAEIDLILACSIDGRAAEPGEGDSPCDLIDGSVNAGLSVGQCLSSFPTPLLVADRTADVLEENTTINATAGGLNLALGAGDRVSVTSAADGGSVLGPIDVAPGFCGEGDCQPICNGVNVYASETACDEISGRLAISVVETPPPLSHALLLDVERTATNDFLKVAICPGYKWTCDEEEPPPVWTVPNTSYVGQVPYSVVYTPLTARFSRITLCSTCRK
jgi:hypothetical protein